MSHPHNHLQNWMILHQHSCYNQKSLHLQTIHHHWQKILYHWCELAPSQSEQNMLFHQEHHHPTGLTSHNLHPPELQVLGWFGYLQAPMNAQCFCSDSAGCLGF
ncbi:hypothetical protein HanRHA438_Chr02g0095171 [Helianthus annuus]|nr:hypothetical protein HanRHA438_Chr02g0095171 [Helianthus annuus]